MSPQLIHIPRQHGPVHDLMLQYAVDRLAAGLPSVEVVGEGVGVQAVVRAQGGLVSAGEDQQLVKLPVQLVGAEVVLRAGVIPGQLQIFLQILLKTGLKQRAGFDGV